MKQNATNQPNKEDLEFHTVPGMVRLLCGDVIQLDGGPCIVVRSNFSGATCQPLQKRHVERETLGGKKVSFDAKQGVKHISGCAPRYLILERRGDEGLAEFLENNKKSSRLVPQPEGSEQSGETTTESEEVVMARTKKSVAVKTAKKDNGEPAARKGASDEAVTAFIKEQRKADPEVTPAALVKAFRETGQSCSNERMAKLAKG